jgi:hypothetical protein
VQCNMCHRVENGVVSSEVVWQNTLIAQYDTTQDPYQAVSSSTELCQKCHKNEDAYLFKIDMGKASHTSMQCTDCHDAHSLQASCNDTLCHTDTLNPAKAITGHDAAHAKVDCVACHDASGLKVGPVEGGSTWSTLWNTTVGGIKITGQYVSHNLQLKVDCTRCHYTGNPWGLKPVSN